VKSNKITNQKKKSKPPLFSKVPKTEVSKSRQVTRNLVRMQKEYPKMFEKACQAHGTKNFFRLFDLVTGKMTYTLGPLIWRSEGIFLMDEDGREAAVAKAGNPASAPYYEFRKVCNYYGGTRTALEYSGTTNQRYVIMQYTGMVALDMSPTAILENSRVLKKEPIRFGYGTFTTDSVAEGDIYAIEKGNELEVGIIGWGPGRFVCEDRKSVVQGKVTRKPGTVDLYKVIDRLVNVGNIFQNYDVWNNPGLLISVDGSKEETAVQRKGRLTDKEYRMMYKFLSDVIHGNLQAVREQIDAGFDINTRCGISGGSALIEAAERDEVEMVKLLLSRGADLEITDTLSNTALMVAVKEGCVRTVRILLDAGANINAVGKLGEPISDYIRGNSEIIKELRRHTKYF